jgi:nucleotide-binding universal stress UspA family protein
MGGYKMSFVKKIMIPTDGSGYSGYAVEYAVKLCRALDAEAILVSVIDIRYEMYGAYNEVSSGIRIEELVREQIAHALDRHAAEMMGQGLTVRKLIRVGDVIHELLDVIREEGVDMVVIGTHGRKGVSRFLLGSTAEKLVRSAACPVLTVRPGE